MMNKSKLTAGMAAESGLTKVDAEKALGSFLHQVEKALKEGIGSSSWGSGPLGSKPAPSARDETPGRKSPS